MRHGLATYLICAAISGSAFAKEGGPGWEVLRSQAMTASERASYPEAERLFRSALSSLPDPAGAGAITLWNQLGEIEAAQSRLDDAEKDYKRAVQINRKLKQPDDFEMGISLNDLAAISHARGQFASAEALLRQRPCFGSRTLFCRETKPVLTQSRDLC
jgi:tetratricopeptide (TPR) repeat protein